MGASAATDTARLPLAETQGAPRLPLLIACFSALGIGWSVLIYRLAPHWALFPQYGYGHAVPFLCAYLFWLRIKPGSAECRLDATQSVGTATAPVPLWFLATAAGLILLYFPVRILEDANPDWRPLLWVHALLVTLTTLVILDGTLGRSHPAQRVHFRWKPECFRAASLSFPVLFFLVAIPWPTPIEQPVIDFLTRANTASTVEVLALLGVPAIQHGNLIEVGGGVVGIDEGCSGIRSFQAMPMVTLFCGELYRLRLWPRLLLVVSGLVASFLFNIGRTTVLTIVAARQGPGAVEKWHDPAGVTILVACFVSVLLLAMFLERRKARQTTIGHPLRNWGGGIWNRTIKLRILTPLFCSLLAGWIVASEVGVFAWYKVQASRLPAPVTWTLQLPQETVGFTERSLPKKTLALLQCDESKDARWADAESLQWQVIFARWKPGRAASYLSLVHNPQVCLPASGFTLRHTKPIGFCNLEGVSFPYRQYAFEKGGQAIHVFFSVWDDRKQGDLFVANQEAGVWANRLRSVFSGQGNFGQRLLEVAVTGEIAMEEAEERYVAFLKEHLRLGSDASPFIERH